MKSNSRQQPERITKSGAFVQVRWNIARADIESDSGDMIESWDYDYINVRNDAYAEIVEAVVRSRYTASDVEAIIANFSRRKDVIEFLRFQAWRESAKEIANGIDPTPKQTVQITLPLSFTLQGGKYETIADRILKSGFPYEITHEQDGEKVTVFVSEVLSSDQNEISNDPDVIVKIIDLNEAV